MIDRFGAKDEEDKKEARKQAKDELVKAVRAFMKKGDLLEDDFSEKGIERVSNKKLLKLHDLAETVQEKFGSREALLNKVVELDHREKDSGYRDHLEKLGLPALYSRFQATGKR